VLSADIAGASRYAYPPTSSCERQFSSRYEISHERKDGNDRLDDCGHPVALIRERVHMTAINAFAVSLPCSTIPRLSSACFSLFLSRSRRARFQERFSGSAGEIVILFARVFSLSAGTFRPRKDRNYLSGDQRGATLAARM